AGLSVAVMLPNLVWQWRHQFISLDFLAHLHARDLAQGRYSGFFTQQPWVCVNVATVPLVLVGLWFLLAHPAGRRFRLVGWIIVATFAAFAIAGSRAFYAAPIYPVLIAAGSMNLVRLLDRVGPPWGRLGIGVQWTAIAVAGATFA